MRNSSPDIVILGCGLSGMISALSLANQGQSITIIESKSVEAEEFYQDPRSTAITATSKKFFEKIKIWDEVKEISGPIKDIYVVDNKSPQMIHFDSDMITDDEYMGYLVLNIEFKKILFSKVNNHPNITILDKSSYTKIDNLQHGCRIHLLSGGIINCNLILVCDGRKSIAKNQFFSSKIDKNYDQKAITFIVNHEKSHDHTAVEHFLTTGPFAILPLKDEHTSSIVWSINSESADAITQLPLAEIEYLAQQNFGDFLGKIKIVSKVDNFPLMGYLTNSYVNNNIILIADTAHIVHPLAGQGLNQGIKDIESLSDIISSRGINQTSLKQYEGSRSSDNHHMLEITDTLNALFSNKSRTLKLARNIGFNAIEKLPPFKKALIKYAMGRRG